MAEKLASNWFDQAQNKAGLNELLSGIGEPVKELGLYVSTACSLKCRFCVNCSKRLDPRENEQLMTLDTIAGLVEGVLSHQGEIPTVTIAGSEPTQHTNIIQIIDRLSDKPSIGRVRMRTYGIGYGVLRLAELSEGALDEVVVPMDGLTLDEAIQKRGGSQSYAELLRTIEGYQASGVNVTYDNPVSHPGVDRPEAIYGSPLLVITPPNPDGRLQCYSSFADVGFPEAHTALL